MNAYPIKTAADAVAEACGHLNDWGLPNVHALAVALHALATSPTEENRARASALVDRIAPHLPCNIKG